MIHIEDILDDARRFLFREMSREEEQDFKALIMEQIHLLDELILMLLIRDSFAEREAEPGNGDPEHK